MDIQWSLVIFTVLTGLAGWMFVLIAADEYLQKAPKAAVANSVIAIIVAVVGGIASVTHLSHPDRMFAALNHPTSGIFLEAVLTGLFLIFAIIYLILAARKASAGARKIFAILAALAGVILSFAAGTSYMMEAQYTWNNIMLPMAYCATSIPAGFSAYIFVASVLKALDNMGVYGKALLVGGIVAGIAALLYVIVAGVFDQSVGLLILVLVASCAIPIIAGIVGDKGASAVLGWSLVALIATVVGSVAFRCIMWMVSEVPANFFSLPF